MEIIGELRMNPYMNRDNVSLDDGNLALSELKRFQALGGCTVVETTNFGIGRDAEGLARIARMSGLRIIMGTGFYLEHTHPDWLKAMDLDEVTAFIVNDVGGGETQPEIMAGIIGEVGVSRHFTARKRSRCAPRPALRASRPAALHPPAGLGTTGPSRSRCHRGGGCGSSPHRALPHEPEP